VDAVWLSSGVHVSVSRVADTWATSSGSLAYGVNTVMARVHKTKGERGTGGTGVVTSTCDAVTGTEEGVGLAGVGVADGALDRSSSQRGGRCSQGHGATPRVVGDGDECSRWRRRFAEAVTAAR